MDLIDYSRMYLKVVEHQGFSKAAKLFNLNPSSVSRQMTQLEKSLGVRLFNRSTRNLGVTTAGVHYYDRIKKIITDIDNLNIELNNMQSSTKGVLHISMPIGIGEQKIANWLPEFLQLYPDILLNVSYSDNLVDLIEENLDLVIRLSDPKDSSLISLKLADIDFHLCASPQYLSQHGIPKAPEELVNHNCLIYSDTIHQSDWEFVKNKSHKKLRVSGNFSTDNPSSLFNATKQGIGISLMSSWTVLNSLENGELKMLLPGYKVSPNSMGKSAVYILYPHRTHLDKKVRVFIDFLKEKVTSINSIHALIE